jgi:hypothetical protein
VRKTTKIVSVICLAIIALLAFNARTVYRFLRLLGPPTEGCPLFSRLLPIKSLPLSPSDYIEHDCFPGLSSWNPGDVRIYADGRVERETTWKMRNGFVVGCPLHEADKHARIDPQTAQALINHAQQAGFCRLCSAYFPPRNVSVSDAGASVVQISIANHVKTVHDAAGDPPPLFHELGAAIDRLLPMDLLADNAKFSPERVAECNSFREHQAAR